MTGAQLRAQQNFFNVPSSDITKHRKSFFQQQVNFSGRTQQLSTTFDYGLGHGFEVGLNCTGLTVTEMHGAKISRNDHVAPYSPFLLLNAQKRFDPFQHVSFAVGGQTGYTLTALEKSGTYLYSNLIVAPPRSGFKIVTGIYRASNSLFGNGNRLYSHSSFGLQAGLEKNVWKDRLFFQADFISGNHNLAGIVPGVAWYVTRSGILSAGVQIPPFGTHGPYMTVVEFTYNPSSHTAHIN